MRSIALILIAAIPACAQAVFSASGQGMARPPVPPSSFDCAADGSVTNSITGEPVPRAHVNIIAGESSYSTATDSSGNWALANMACTLGQLTITRTGFLQNAPIGPSGRARETAPRRTLQLVSGSPVHSIKTELIPQSVALGKVVDDQGDPIMNAQVTAMEERVFNGRPRFQQAGFGSTNDLGEYRIAGLTRGKYIFCAHENAPVGPILQGAQTIPADSCYPGPVEGGAASAMDVPAGRETKVDFTVSEVPAVHLRGTITGLPEGRGSGLRLERRDSPVGNNLPGIVRDGKFDFRVTPGSYVLAGDYFENGKRLTARVPVDVGTSDVDGIVVHLDSGFTVTGVVRVVSQSGQALNGQFSVGLRSAEPTGGGGQLRWDADHTSFSINDMTPGTYRLNAFPPAPFYVKSATLAGQDILNEDVTVSQAAGPIEVTLRDDGGTIEGDVTDANGQTVAAGVMLLRGTTRVANVATNGHFKLQNVAPGDYMIYAWDDPDEVQYADPDWMRRNGGGGMAVTVTAGESQQIKLVEQIVPPE